MNKHKKLALPLLLILLIASCKLFTGKKKDVVVDYAAQGYVKAEVRDYELDGCRFMLYLNETQKLEPDYIPTEFQQDSALVWIKYQAENRMSICMAGETVKLIDIKKR
jgi:hypothetical protein